MPPVPLRIRLDPANPAPAYRQITDQLRTLAMEGAVAPGDRLPPVRRLSLDLGVHFNTVAEAYRILQEEGLLEIVHGHGARIAARTRRRPTDPEAAAFFRQRLRELVATVRTRGLSTRQIASELRLLAEGVQDHE